MADHVLDLYSQLPMDDQVRLLKNPHGRLSPGLMERISRSPVIVSGDALFTSNEPTGTGVRLSTSLAQQLDDICDQLEEWWVILDPEDRDYLIEHRAEELDAEYAELVLAADDGQPEGLIGPLVRDSSGRFRLPGMIAVFVEMKAA